MNCWLGVVAASMCFHNHLKIGLLPHGTRGCLKKKKTKTKTKTKKNNNKKRTFICGIFILQPQQWSKPLISHSLLDRSLDTIKI